MGLEIPDKDAPPVTEARKKEPEPEEEIIVNSISLFQLAEEEVRKIALIGNANTGKTHAGCIELIDMLLSEGIDPNDIRIEYLDLDGGIAQLIAQRTFPKEYFKRINYTLCNRFAVVEKATQLAIDSLSKFVYEGGHPLSGAWIVIDNTKRAWRWVQDDYCRAVYGMSLTDKMEKARKSQIEAKKKGPDVKGDTVFNRNLDYSVITPIHNEWFTSFATCPFNVLFLSPWSQEEIKDEKNSSKVIGYKDRWGQSDNELIPDYIVKKYFGPKRERIADFTKSRATDSLPTQIKNPTLANLFKALNELRDREMNIREKEMKKKTFKPLKKETQGQVIAKKEEDQEPEVEEVEEEW